MKKAFYIAFAFYFILLALKPCGDQSDCNERTKSEQCRESHKHEGAHKDEDCTPFCSCSCCAGVFLGSTVSAVAFRIPAIHTVYISYNDTPETGAIIPIWQPPKIS